VEAQFATLRQHHNRHGGELLGYRPQIKRSVRRDWPPSFKISEAIALLVDDLIAVYDEKRGTWTLRRVHVGEDIIDLAVQLAHRSLSFQGTEDTHPRWCRGPLPAKCRVWVIHVIPAIAACPVRPKSGHSANARVYEHAH